MIQIQNLDKTIENKPILKDISVDIEKGKLTSLIGPNGAGKSTLLSAMSRLFNCDNGTISIEDKVISDYKT
ncbi:ATP-binding cassette domain-containing protein, partial [Staphylococcus epidermidis]